MNIGVEHPIHFPIHVFGTEETLADGFLIRENGAESVVEDPRPPACIRSVGNVIRAVREGKQPLVTPEEAARSCAVAFAATRPYREGGRPVDVSEFAVGPARGVAVDAPGVPEHGDALLGQSV